MSDLPPNRRTLRSQNTFLVLTHYRPDGDAVGSQLALAPVPGLGKTVEAWNDDEVPTKFRFLPAARSSAPARQAEGVRCRHRHRHVNLATGRLRRAAHRQEEAFHQHRPPRQQREICRDQLDRPEAPASGQIVFDLIKRGGFKLTRDIAICLFAAISTDTGSFKYANTTAESLRVAAELVDTGINVGEICRHVYESYPFARLQLLQKALADFKLADHNRIAYCWVTKEMFEESGAKREDTEGLIDYARSIEGVLVAVLFEEMPEPQRSASVCARNIRRSTSTPSRGISAAAGTTKPLARAFPANRARSKPKCSTVALP